MSHSEFQTITNDLERVRGGCCINIGQIAQLLGGMGGASPGAAAQQPSGQQAASPAAAQPSGGQGMNPATMGQQIGALVDQFAPNATKGQGAGIGGQLGGLVSSFMSMGGGQQS